MLIYDNSIEEQRYLSQIRREKYAFERLIKEKSVRYITKFEHIINIYVFYIHFILYIVTTYIGNDYSY